MTLSGILSSNGYQIGLKKLRLGPFLVTRRVVQIHNAGHTHFAHDEYMSRKHGIAKFIATTETLDVRLTD